MDVVVLGSLHYDITVSAPDRPRRGETLMGHAWAPKFGGKGGNQAVAAAAAGAATAMIGAVGDDDFGRSLLAHLAETGVEASGVRVVPGGKSGMSVAIFDADGDYGAVVVSGANLTLDGAGIEAELGRLQAAKVLILQNEIPESANLRAAEAVAVAGGRVILNAAPARDTAQALLDRVDLLVVNAVEAEMLAGTAPFEDLAGAVEAAQVLLGRCRAVIVTAGGAGAVYRDRQGLCIPVPAEKVQVVSTHGAGDCYVGTLAARLTAGDTIEAAMGAAGHAAALLVSGGA